MIICKIGTRPAKKSGLCYVLAISSLIFAKDFKTGVLVRSQLLKINLLPMTPFLKQVADHYYKEGHIEEKCFVFPNRRSMAFFRKYLSEAVAAAACSPLIVPEMMTVNDFFSRASELQVADRVSLLVKLYECYSALTPQAEPLDEFIFWGDVILGDFNDVDKYLANPKQIFTNIADYKSIQDNFEYLTQNQRKAIESFAGHFIGKGPKESDNPNAKDVRASFLQIWNILHSLYKEFNSSLAASGLAYEGAVYRKFAESVAEKPVADVLATTFGASSYVFVGLNALNECEKAVMSKMKDAGMAEFCWDYSGDMISDPLNKSSFFMSKNVKDYPQAFSLDPEGVGMPRFNVLSVPSSYGQVKHVEGILSKVGLKASESDCAIVLPDEGLLMPLLNSIPEEVTDINVTMGYPMSYSELWSLMGDIMKMQMHVNRKDGRCRFYHKYVWDVFSNALFRKLMDGEEMKPCRERVAQIKQAARYYISQEDLSGFPLFDMVFRPVVNDMAAADSEQISSIAAYQQEVISFMAPLLMKNSDVALEIDFAKEYWCAVNRLKAMNLKIMPSTYLKLLDSLLSGVAVPFSGEPLKGLQIMGPLETRALDFRNVVILSCNEGVFPRRSVSSSFVPPELRKGFGLPTYEYQDAVWAYYFYRLVSRAETVWMLYDSRTEGLRNGEESRYIKQLRYHFHADVNTYVSDAEPGLPSGKEHVVEKTPEMLRTIADSWLSPSSLQNYVDCPMRFYYYSVEKLKKDREVAETMDPAMIGNVYHNTMWALFVSEDEMMSDTVYDKRSAKPDFMRKVTLEYLDSWKDRDADVKRKVESLVKNELGTDEILGRNLVVVSVIVRYVMETIRRDIQLLRSYGADHFEILGLEEPISAGLYGLKFFGVADRIDRIGSDGNVRLVDYKSGKDDPSVLMAAGDSAADIADAIFSPEKEVRRKVKAGLQFFIYDKMLSEKGVASLANISNSMYATAGLFADVPRVCPLDSHFASEMDERLEKLISEIQDPEVPFRMTQDEGHCEWCDFKMICGR